MKGRERERQRDDEQSCVRHAHFLTPPLQFSPTGGASTSKRGLFFDALHQLLPLLLILYSIDASPVIRAESIGAFENFSNKLRDFEARFSSFSFHFSRIHYFHIDLYAHCDDLLLYTDHLVTP